MISFFFFFFLRNGKFLPFAHRERGKINIFGKTAEHERKNADIKIHANKLFVHRISHRIESITKVGIKYFPRRNNKKTGRK